MVDILDSKVTYSKGFPFLLLILCHPLIHLAEQPIRVIFHTEEPKINLFSMKCPVND